MMGFAIAIAILRDKIQMQAIFKQFLNIELFSILIRCPLNLLLQMSSKHYNNVNDWLIV